jgi:hypothetical protein
MIPPAATGMGDWDLVGGLVGMGGVGGMMEHEPTAGGNAGCVRIFTPGFCSASDDSRWWVGYTRV